METRVASAHVVKLVCFELCGQEYGADIRQVKETLAVRPITRVFLTAPWLAGIINLRGDIVAVLDLAQLLGLPATAVTDDSRIVITRHDGMTAGVLVDRMAALRTLDVAASPLQPAPPTLAADTAALLAGIATVEHDRPLRVLDLARLFESDRVRALSRE